MKTQLPTDATHGTKANSTLRRWRTVGMTLLTALGLIGLFTWGLMTTSVAAATIVVDGIIDAAYGPPLAVDALTDGNGNDVMDLGSLYVTHDDDNLYVAFTIDGDIGADNWGKYVLYIDTTNDTRGATSDTWTRNVIVADPHKPEFGLYSWVDCTTYDASCTQFWRWTGGQWLQDGTLDAVARTTGATSVLEWRIARSRLGNPNALWLEVWSTGGGAHDNAQDTINDPAEDWNATDWSSQSTLLVSTHYILTPITLEITHPNDGDFFPTAAITLTGRVSPTTGLTVTVALGAGFVATPTIDAAGHFTQPLTLSRGRNTITTTATDGVARTEAVRTVWFGAEQDDNVMWYGLLHDSRNPNYRTPGGAVPAGTPVTLRLRTYHNDVTEVALRLYDDRLDRGHLLPMTLERSEGGYDYWSRTLTPTQATVLWYRFIIRDGTDIDYYEDDLIDAGGIYRGYLEGGPGTAYDESPDLSFQLTVYDPTFHTPDWMKEATIYQILPDRFRNGDSGNDIISGTHPYYDNPAGGITYTTWNSPVIDPRDPTSPYFKRWCEDFYGGDLEGINEKLDELHAMGITALYLNPIFLSPSNHKYDTADYEQVDLHLGGNAALLSLLTAAEARGMHVILDGVFNHTASDSRYFDRYSRYTDLGAYESQTSPYFDWYTFDDWPDDYRSWWGYDTLPILRSANPAVRTYIYSGTAAIATRWVLSGTAGWRLDVGGDIDPGLTRAPDNTYWEGFRAAVKAADPEAVIIGEEWGDATPWLLGEEWDAVMNYRFRSALLSFLRDRRYEDNDNNTASYGGVLDPITPSQLDAWLHSLEEDYPPEAWAAMMNLLDSHDTNRLRFVLSKGQRGEDTTHQPYNPATDLSPTDVDAYQRLIALLQFTLPGAPTVYYGDEVGLDAPGAWYNDKWEDDPYNRAPYPWPDTPGTYQTRPIISQTYHLLGETRQRYPALRRGTFDTLLVDDTAQLYGYGRRADNEMAIIILNRGATVQTATLSLAGYVGEGVVFSDTLALTPMTATVSGGQLILEVPPMWGRVLVPVSGDLTPPAAPTLLDAEEGNGEVELRWTAIAEATAYRLYRAPFAGGIGQLITTTTATSYTDTDVTNGLWYYYTVRAVDAADNVSLSSNEKAAMPHLPIDDATLVAPSELSKTLAITPSAPITGAVIISGVTSQPGPTEGLVAQLGYGPSGTLPITWAHWVAALFVGDAAGGDCFAVHLVPESAGDYHLVYRYSTTGGRDWTYADLSGIISPTAPISPALLHVVSGTDTIPPATPLNLHLVGQHDDRIILAWSPVGDTDLYAYDLYRTDTTHPSTAIARIPAGTTIYTDTTVIGGERYTYTVRALDIHFNRSAPSNPVSVTAAPREVEVHFYLTVPGFTPGTATVYVAGSDAALFGAAWDPHAAAMTPLNPRIWVYTATVEDGTTFQYKYTRGSWETVEAWGAIQGFANREATAIYGTTGVMTLTDTVHNWRDPLVMAYAPEPGACLGAGHTVSVALSTEIQAAGVNTETFRVVREGESEPASGNFTFHPLTWQETDTNYGIQHLTGTLILFTPTVTLEPSARYTVTLIHDGFVSDVPMQEDFSWSFGGLGRRIYLPLVLRGH